MASITPTLGNSRVNLLLIDDHPLFAMGFVHALTHRHSGSDIRTALTLDEGLAVAANWPQLDIAIFDYRLGGDDGLSGLRRFGERFPLVARLMISGDEDPLLVARARAAGACGFLGKSMPMSDVRAALDKVHGGGEWFPRAPLSVRTLGRLDASPRQLEVLAMVGMGRQNKQIAHDLGIAERTVKLHITSLLAITGARNRTHLLARARELGWLS